MSGLEASPFWVHCSHRKTRDGLINLLHILLGDAKHIADATCHWLELLISHLLYIRPLTNVNLCGFSWFFFSYSTTVIKLWDH